MPTEKALHSFGSFKLFYLLKLNEDCNEKLCFFSLVYSETSWWQRRSKIVSLFLFNQYFRVTKARLRESVHAVLKACLYQRVTQTVVLKLLRIRQYRILLMITMFLWKTQNCLSFPSFLFSQKLPVFIVFFFLEPHFFNPRFSLVYPTCQVE